MTKGPVTQEWVHAIPFMQQTVLLTAIRGPDGVAKYHPSKFLLRWFRRCILLSAMDGKALTNPYDSNGGSFTGPSIDAPADGNWWGPMDEMLARYIRSLDELPHHFQLHFLHAAEIIGYKHPDPVIRGWWRQTYERLVHDMHLWPEDEHQLNARLGDNRSGWLARADMATVE